MTCSHGLGCLMACRSAVSQATCRKMSSLRMARSPASLALSSVKSLVMKSFTKMPQALDVLTIPPQIFLASQTRS